MPRAVIYLVIALCGAVVCLVVAVGVRDEFRRPPSLRRRLVALVAFVLASFALWAMAWPVVAPDGQYCGLAPGILTATATDIGLWLNSPAAEAHQACSASRWFRLILGLAASVTAIVALGLSRRTAAGSI
jgi:hypothetical protein